MRHIRSGSLGVLVVGAVLLSGCTGSTPQEVYTHHWFWGPGAYSEDELPVFEDAFEVSGDGDELEVHVQWSIDTGRAAIVLTPPGGEAVNHTDEETNGPDDDGEFRVATEPGLWGFRIPTWRAEDGGFPAGEVQVDVIEI